MKPPIVVVDDDIDIFESVTDAERYVEVPDVRRGRVRIFDAEGCPIRAAIVTRLLAEAVKLESDDRAAPEPEQLRLSLARFLAARERSEAEAHPSMPLDELLARAVKYRTR